MFLPTTIDEMKSLGWDDLDIILVSGDTYIDSPFMGPAVIGKILLKAGFKVGIIAQPDFESDEALLRLGRPRLFWGVSGGSVDSMVANYTALGKKRRTDDYTPGGVNERRPDRASLVYSNAIRRAEQGEHAPIVLGGIEASLRRVSHYDYWSEKIRRSLLFDAKADYLIYGMGERATCELADALRDGQDPSAINGLCYIASEPPQDAIELPSHAAVVESSGAFIEMFHTFYQSNDPVSGQRLCQLQDTRWLVQNPPARYLLQEELDEVHELGYEHAVHPYYATQGAVRAMETIRNSLVTHRGCYGECNFCAIAVHQGRSVRSRSVESVLREAKERARDRGFNGVINDVGGPTANMFGYDCARKRIRGACKDRRCLTPTICPHLKPTHQKQITLLGELRKISGVRRVFVASGIRPDLVQADEEHGAAYIRALASHHVSGQLKLAPEHVCSNVLDLMGKPGPQCYLDFKKTFDHESRLAGHRQFLTYYFIAAHPGCTEDDMYKLRRFAAQDLEISPEQVQVFTPTPSTYSTLMYATGRNPFTGEMIHVERSVRGRMSQRDIIAPPHKLRRSGGDDRGQHGRQDRSQGHQGRRQFGGPRQETRGDNGAQQARRPSEERPPRREDRDSRDSRDSRNAPQQEQRRPDNGGYGQGPRRPTGSDPDTRRPHGSGPRRPS
jgi:uncharacterized radical SAM protein YgiQ